MRKIFTKEKSNFGRQEELDLAKGLAIIFMIIIHVNELYQSKTLETGMYNRVIEFIGSPPAAPIFMMMLGIGIVYSKKSNAKILFKRGLILLVLSYILNIFRDFIPHLILAKVNNDISYIKTGLDLMWAMDILQFAALVFIFFAFVKKFKINNMYLFIIWCGFATLNIFLSGVSFDNNVLNTLGRFIWGTDSLAWFPFLSWIAFPILGYFFGELLIRCTNKTVFYKNLLILTSSLSVLLWIYAYVNNVQFGAFGELYQGAYYHQEFMGNIILCVFALFWISLCYFAYGYLPEMVKNIMERYSKNTDMMYCVHWIIISYSMLVLEVSSYMQLQLFIIAGVLLIATDVICIFISSVKLKKKSCINGGKLSINN